MSMTLLEMKRSHRGPARGRAGVPRQRTSGAGSRVRGAHVPVLARELIELLEASGLGTLSDEVAIDCTFGDGGHARLVAERLGPSGTLVAIDRDPLAEERFAALAAETACSLRFIRSGYAEALQTLAEEGLRADIAFFHLGMSSVQ